jgi:hypothetical protein
MNGKGIIAGVLTACYLITLPVSPSSDDTASWSNKFQEALVWITEETSLETEYNYVMTAKLRMLLFWIGRDDVGGGYIRLRKSYDEPGLECIELKMGSDPDKAPRRINRWGAATEVIRKSPAVQSGAFFGFWKSSKGESPEAMESEFEEEASEGRYPFQAAVDRIEPDSVVSYVLSFFSEQDLDMHQLDETRQMIFTRMWQDFDESKIKYFDKTVDGECSSSNGFLFTVKNMIDRTLAGEKAPLDTCYVYNGTLYTMTLKEAEPVFNKQVEFKLHSGEKVRKKYSNLMKTRFRVLNHRSGRKTSFELLIGTRDDVRGIPVQIVHQPKWWFKVILNLNHISVGSS